MNYMKKCVKLLVAGALIGAAAGAVKLVKSGALDDKLYSGVNEDMTFKAMETFRLLGDLLAWPIHFVKALLP